MRQACPRMRAQADRLMARATSAGGGGAAGSPRVPGSACLRRTRRAHGRAFAEFARRRREGGPSGGGTETGARQGAGGSSSLSALAHPGPFCSCARGVRACGARRGLSRAASGTARRGSWAVGTVHSPRAEDAVWISTVSGVPPPRGAAGAAGADVRQRGAARARAGSPPRRARGNAHGAGDAPRKTQIERRRAWEQRGRCARRGHGSCQRGASRAGAREHAAMVARCARQMTRGAGARGPPLRLITGGERGGFRPSRGAAWCRGTLGTLARGGTRAWVTAAGSAMEMGCYCIRRGRVQAAVPLSDQWLPLAARRRPRVRLGPRRRYQPEDYPRHGSPGLWFALIHAREWSGGRGRERAFR